MFAKLLAIMLIMATCLLALVGFFFGGVLLPQLNQPLRALVADYTRLLAATQPDPATAKALDRKLDIGIRYDGPQGTWMTRDNVANVDGNGRAVHTPVLFGGRGYYTAPAPDGGRYVFRWNFDRKIIRTHNLLLLLLLVLMASVVVTTWFMLRRLLRPLRTLGDGVARLSNGQLDVVLPNPTRDEFGALTDGFNQMVGRVRDMVRARDQLLLDVSHELRSPVTRLRVALELLPDDANRRHMKADVEEMELMIAELLELERLRDKRGITTAPHDLVALMQETIAYFDNVRLVSAPAELWLPVDAEKMQAVFRNLIENAVKYSLSDSRPVEVSMTPSMIRVSDDGPGIPDEDLANIFEPFFRVNRSRAKTTPGYGLGLSICRRIVEAHGGTITAENHAGRGAVFTVTLPKR